MLVTAAVVTGSLLITVPGYPLGIRVHYLSRFMVGTSSCRGDDLAGIAMPQGDYMSEPVKPQLS